MAEDSRLRVMLDPSLLLLPDSLDRSAELVTSTLEEDAGVEFFVPDTFASRISSSRGLSQFDFFAGGGAVPVDQQRVEEVVYGLELRRFPREPDWEEGDLGPVPATLLRTWRNQTVARVLAEEWLFLTTMSFIVGRLKRTFTAFADAGAVGVEFLGDRILDPLVRRTLKLDKDATLNRVQRLRAVGKWIAVGAGSASAVLIPPALSVAAGTGIGIFLLIDPPASAYRPIR